MDDQTDRAGVVVLPPLLMLAALILALTMHYFLPLPVGMRSLTMALGIALVAVGIGVGVWGRITLLKAGTTVNPLKPTTAIATGGPFQFTRNPLYVGMISVFIGISLAVGTLWGFVVLVPTFLVLHFGVVLREERYLERKSGESYLAYKKSVRRYL